MKVLIVNRTDKWGGAARAAENLFHGLKDCLSKSVNVEFLAEYRTSTEEGIIGYNDGKPKLFKRAKKLIDLLPYLLAGGSKEVPFSVNLLGSKTATFINKHKPDIVHLHWIGNGFLPIKDFSKIKSPIVWTLHDSWAFTGGCHFSNECERYTEKCGNCPLLKKKAVDDISNHILNTKIKEWKNLDLTIITPSNWLADCARKSTVLKNKRVVVIPNSINTKEFFAEDKAKARKDLGIPKDKNVIVFGAMDSTKDPRKGFDLLDEAIETLSKDKVFKKGTVFIVFGSAEKKIAKFHGVTTHYLGRISDNNILRKAYSSGDIMIVPSRYENFPYTIMEAMACGTPVVAFNIGGNSDLVAHEKNGYLAKPYSTNDLVEGISKMLAMSVKQKKIVQKSAGEFVAKNYNLEVISKKHIELYQKILS